MIGATLLVEWNGHRRTEGFNFDAHHVEGPPVKDGILIQMVLWAPMWALSRQMPKSIEMHMSQNEDHSSNFWLRQDLAVLPETITTERHEKNGGADGTQPATSA